MRYKGFIVPRSGSLGRLKRADISAKAKIKLSWMEYYQKVGNARLTCRHFGISPDTFYRWKKRYRPYCLVTLEDNPKTRRPKNLRIPTTDSGIISKVRYYREIYPRWGKEKINILLKREGIFTSVSTVGRTIKRLKEKGILKEPVPNFISSKKRFLKRAWGVRKPEGYTPRFPGDLLQIDTLDVRPIPGVVRKQFTARDVVSKWDCLEVYGSATANLAAKFLDSVILRIPFAIKAIQVDGGSEFMKEFEAECHKRGIRLFVLPPKQPKLNGCVERSNRTHTEEFYEVNDFSLEIIVLNQQLREWEKVYNTIRPHQSLDYLTPLEYITNLQRQERRSVRDVLN